MKKLFVLLAVCAVAVACNDDKKKAEEAAAAAMQQGMQMSQDAYQQAMDYAEDYM